MNCENMDGKITQVPAYAWRVRLDHVFPEKLNQMLKPKLHQIWSFVPLLFRYIWYCVTMWWNGRRVVMNFYAPLTSNQWSGVPLGGIGGGTICRSFRGEFCRYQMRPGFYDYNVVHANQFIVTVQNSEGTVVYQQVLSPLSGAPGGKLSAWKWGFPGDQAKYTALYPRAWTEYNISEQNLRLTCRQISPVIPHNYKDSCVPGGVFVWSVENLGSEVKSISITCTLKNGVGSKQDAQGSCHSEPMDVNRDGVQVAGVQIHQLVDNMDCTYCLSALVKEDVAVSRIVAFDPNGDGSGVWNSLAKNGQLTSQTSDKVGREVACAVCAYVEVPPGNMKTLEFALVWDMPRIHFHLNTKEHYRYYTKYFGKDGEAGPVISHFSLANFSRWEEEISAWQRPILEDLKLPEWYKSAIFNEVYYVADGGTVWLLMDDVESLSSTDPRREFGRFAYLEGHEYRMYNTYDVHFYASFTLSQLWPQLQACLQFDFRDTVLREETEQRVHLFDGKIANRKDINAIPHDLGDPSEEPFVLINAYNIHDVSEWRDLNLKFVLQCYRDYVLSRNVQYLRDMWTQVLAVMSKAETWDTDGDGVIENAGAADQTYDAWIMTGTSAYCGSLWLASLCCVTKMAAILDCPEVAEKYSTLLTKAKASFHKKLWNGQYYNFDSAQRPHSTSVMADQLCGLWYLHACSITDEVFPQANVKSALETIYRLNVKGFRDGKMGAVNGMLPEGTIDDFAIQSEEVWTGVTYGLASLMIFEGMVEEGFHTASGIYETVYNRIGLGFETPEALHHSNSYRSIGYMRPLSIWAIQMAWQRRQQASGE
ncbi:non-lysosomal glucosylceramidase isoform X2 [Homalodisca vitripennis]|uniref:non-lysosomal glucosylceramidase isoform X2 n=1 Tax=Homalodisca vitripennis TaxID=197043 RepID=UPI001EEB588D|nr:non-lysosomal glucosylceramidase isoform X2 [Homalodisca vitripennis]